MMFVIIKLNKNKRREQRMKKIMNILLVMIGVILLGVVLLLLYLRITEYRPEDTETVTIIEGEDEKELSYEDAVSILTYNIGYGALSKEEDFFMDGGKTVQVDSKDVILKNIEGITKQIQEQNADVVFLQEADRDSKRSYGIDELQSISNSIGGSMAFAPNFVCKFIPYPWPPIGKVNSGIAILSKYQTANAQRIAFPSSFRWPVSMCNLKRCLLVERAQISGTDKEMVFVNLHLEAYDSGEGKLLQSKILADLMNEEYEKGNYVIAGGDFNQTFSCVDESKYPVKNEDYFVAGQLPEDYFGDGWQIVMDDTVPTSRLLNEPYDPDSENTQYYMLDGFIVSPNLEIEELETQDYGFTYSDHNPVRITVKFK
jgi:endonuclease/exonuclease/phosphatase family metal-dependent hydrolase